MKIGKVSFPPYFNTEFLVFKPHLFLKEHFEAKFVFIKLPILFLFLKFCGGAFNFVSDGETKENFRWLTDILRGTTELDKLLESYFGIFASHIDTMFNLGGMNNSLTLLILAWLFIGLIFFLKIMTVYYIFGKFLLIFLFDMFKKDMTFEEKVNYEINNKKNGKTKEEIIEDEKDMEKFISLFKRC
ncbi:hypothetical protein N5U00_08255 [Aliarcobacter butzleri]|uniref:hypothetical protein n=1 Tax=Aliarcobacter butzleri TaxID=28197 RepID=UPI0021B640FA|nr:hypothetical protein [Aliarcobacter butzleri]MCT7575320.1 hypothetical protein [Aliarcobacter butzleri]